jgi:hypothetical protein
VTRLFIRDFAPQADVFELEGLFSNVGNVRKATLQEQVLKGVLRQVAYIEMSSPEEASDCIERFHGMTVDGYTLTVTADKPHVPDPTFRFKRPVVVAPKSARK